MRHGASLALTALLLAGTPLVRADGDPLDARLAAACDETLGRGVAEGHSSAAVAVFVRDGAIRFAKAWGYEDAQHRFPVDPSTSRFQIASISKAFTSVALAQLHARGEIRSFDDPVNGYLSSFQVPDWPGHPIRLRELATHTAGLDEDMFGLFQRERRGELVTGTMFTRQMPRLFRAPGGFAAYSNFGANILGQVIAQTSGVTWGEYIERNILRPLGMLQSVSTYPTPPLAHEVEPFDPKNPQDTRGTLYARERSAASGGFESTGLDMARFALALLDANDTDRVISPAIQQEMFKVWHENGPGGSRHGLLWDEFSAGARTLVHHGGSLGGNECFLALVPTDRTGLFYCFTSFSPGANKPLSILKVAESLLFTLLAGSPGQQQLLLEANADLGTTPWKPEWQTYLGRYVSLRRHHFGWGRLASLLRPDIIVVARGTEGLTIAEMPGWRESQAGIFRKAGSLEAFSFTVDSVTRREILSRRLQASAYEALAPVDDPALWLPILATAFVITTSGLLFPLWRFARPAATAAAFGAGAAVLAMQLLLLLNSPFGVRYFVGDDWPLVTLRVLAYLIVPIALLLLAVTVAAWWQSLSGRAALARLHLSLLAVAGVTSILVLADAGLIGLTAT